MKNSIHKALLAVAVATAGLLVSCGGGGGGSAPATGTVQFSLTDAPACGFDAVNVTVVKVRVHKSASAEAADAGWTDVTLNPARKINLVTLTNGKLLDLGQAPLGVGHYTQIRLVLAPNTKETPLANSVVLTSAPNNEIALDTPSAVQTGIKLNHEFDVAANTLVAFTLDFNACKSVVTRGNGSYGLKPVVRVIPVIVSGAINGFIAPTTAAHPLVSAQLNGVEIKSTIPDATGAFSLSPLVQTAAGSGYTVVVTADNSATDVITNVPVVAQSTTILSTNTAQINLATSSTRTASGTVLPIAAQASVRASQTYGTGSTAVKAEIKFTNVDANGAYTLTLPTSAAMLGTFGPLPITFASQSASAAMYAIEASALGYATQSVSADLTSLNFTHDFNLSPN